MIRSLNVEDKYEEKGVDTLLLRRVIAALKGGNVSYIIMETSLGNKSVIKALEKEGFLCC